MGNLKFIKMVTAFITRGATEEADLLLFEHPDACIQLPAGTVEVTERPEEAVFREAAEETGLTGLRMIKLLGRQSYSLVDGDMAILRLTKLFDQPAYDSSSGGLALTRGSSVRVKGKVGEFSLVHGDALDLKANEAERINHVEGYVRTSLLTNQMERYFYHLQSHDSHYDQWDVSVDGLVLRCFWTPLRSNVKLNQWQQPWLNDYFEALEDSLTLESPT